MKKINLEEAEEIHSLFKSFSNDTRYKFRGQADSNWKLIPRCGRKPLNNKNDQEIFRHWKRRAKGILENNYNSETEYLTIAQHTGLPTRLLDWSHNPLTALFFCVSELENIDGAVYVYKVNSSEFLKDIDFDPFKIDKDFEIYQPTSTINRLDNQYGYFTIHKDPQKPFEKICKKECLTKIIIPKILKKELLIMLNQYGVNYLTVYPDLEGLSKHLTWFYENQENWK